MEKSPPMGKDKMGIMNVKFMDQYLDYLEHERRCSQTTLRTVSGLLKRYSESSLSINSFIKNESLSPATQNKNRTILFGYHEYLVREGMAKLNPISKIPRSIEGKRLPRYAKEYEINQIINGVNGDDFVSIRDRAILEYGISIGARIGDFNIKTSQVDLENYVVRLIGKGNKEAVLPLTENAVIAIKKYLEKRIHFDSEYLFVSEKGMPISDFYNIIKKYVKEYTPHQFNRHSLATSLLTGGVDIALVSRLLRHSSISTTSRYLGCDTSRYTDVYKTIHPRRNRVRD